MQGVETIKVYCNWCADKGYRACEVRSLKLFNQAKARGEV